MNKKNGIRLVKDIILTSDYPAICNQSLVDRSSAQQDKLSVVKGFTLLEVMIVTTILAALATTTVVALNPVELLAQMRDSQRMTTIGMLRDAVSLLIADRPATSLGDITRVYISLPSNNDNCADIVGLPALPAGQTYRCVTATNLTRIDGAGWIPLDFRGITDGSPFTHLPIDVINTPTSFYSYIPAPGGRATITARIESIRQRTIHPSGIFATHFTAAIDRPPLGTGQVVVPLGSTGAPSYTFIGDLNTGVFSPGADSIGFSTAGILRMSIDNMGNIGIGTTTPGERLTVAGIIHSTTGGFRFPDGTIQTTATAPLMLIVNSTGTPNVPITGTHGGGLFTNYTVTGIASGTNINLFAPVMAGNQTFSNWTGCDSVSGTGNRTCNLTLNTARTVTVNYYTFMTLAAGADHTIAIRTTDGTLWAWGTNGYGSLGLGDNIDRLTPTQVGTDTNWRQVAANGWHSLAVREDGTLWAWGRNLQNQLGLGDNIDRLTPTQVGTDTNWRQVSTSSSHSIAIRTDGTLWVWGRNNGGQLGLNDTTNRHIPTRVGTDTNWSRVAAGSGHTLAIRTDGTLWAWGANESGQLGLNDTINRHIPTRVGTDTNWSRVEASSGHTLAIRTDGTLWVWGRNNFGQLGLNDTTNRLVPTRVGTNIWKWISAGQDHALAIRTDGTLWVWGRNEFGQLGLGDNIDRLTPTQVGTSFGWRQVATNFMHTIAIITDGTLWAWGSNNGGQLGLGTLTVTTTHCDEYGFCWEEITTSPHPSISTPIQVGTDTNW